MNEPPRQPAANEATRVRPADSSLFPWYDSNWLTRYVCAKAILRQVRPEALADFENALRIFRTPLDFQPHLLEQVFDEARLSRMRAAVAALHPTELELHEARRFGRFVVHGHPCFTELQRETVSLVSDIVGEPVEAFYNFLSLYGNMGVCATHMDAPEAKYTLDLCLNQSEPWPIYFSQVVPWPENGGEPWARQDWEENIKRSPELRFSPCVLQPGQAVLFSGSSQWHYREALPRTSSRQFCDLLFFHYIPRGTSDLVNPANWARLFGIPELAADAPEPQPSANEPA